VPRLRQALRLGSREFDMMSLRELTQFAFARGEEVVIGVRDQADAVFAAVDAAFTKDPGEHFDALWQQLMSRVHYRRKIDDDEYLEHNRRAAQKFINTDVH